MRPLTLTFAAVRSWRKPTTFDFSELELAAIVGPTGAGKSSVLEALTYALFGRPTWQGGTISDLITSGEPTMTVALRFVVDGDIWQVRRSTSRGQYPPSVHELTCERDDTERYDGRADVDAKIVELLGLDFDGFLRTVVLPQGRFAALLHSSPTDRTRILARIFGYDRIAQVADRASVVKDQLTVRIEDLQQRQIGLPADPRAEHDAIRSLIDELTPVRATLTDTLEVYTGHDADARQADVEAAEAVAAESALDAARIRVAERDKLDRAIAALATVDADRTQVDGKISRAIDEHRPTTDRIQQLADERLTVAVLAAATATLQAAVRLPVLREEVAAAAATDRTAAREAETTRQSLATARTAADEEMKKARDALDDAAGRVEALSAAQSEITRCQAESEEVANRQRDAETAVDDAVERLVAAKQRLQPLEVKLEEATRALDLARRADLVGAAAGHLHAGDDCPICDRVLPDGWRPPAVPGQQQAEDDQAGAADDVDRARSDVAACKGRHDAAIAELKSATETAAGVAARLEAAEAAVVATFEITADEVPAAVEAASSAATRGRDALRTAQQTAEDAALAVRSAENDEQSRAQAAGRLIAELEQSAQELAARVNDLPDEVRPSGHDSAAITAAAAAAEAYTAELEQLAAATAAHQETIGELRDRRSELDRQASDHVPVVERFRADAHALTALLDEPIGDLDAADGAALVVLLDIAVAAARAKRDRLHDEATQLAAAADALRRQAREVLEDAEAATDRSLADRDALVQAKATVDQQLSDAQANLAELAEQIPKVAELNGALEACRTRRSACGAVRENTTQAQFPSWLVARREHALLGIASEILASLTHGRYGFAAGFQVVDTEAGETRDPKTLSGGETFLASLSLAFALVEMTSRAGARIDALLLDEGFGSLSPDALEVALDALAASATGQRMICVISHVPEVADRVDAVIEVSRTADGASHHIVRGAEPDLETLDALPASA